MDPFSYLSVLTSIVLALGITRVLTGLGKLLQAQGHIRVYWVHQVWALNVFLYQTLNWWILFRWQRQEQWTFFLFLFVLLSPTVAFLLSMLLFPDVLDDGLDLRQHYYANHRWFFTLGALLAPIDAMDTLLKGRAPFYRAGAALRHHPGACLCAKHRRFTDAERAVSPILCGLFPHLSADVHRHQPALADVTHVCV